MEKEPLRRRLHCRILCKTKKKPKTEKTEKIEKIEKKKKILILYLFTILKNDNIK